MKIKYSEGKESSGRMRVVFRILTPEGWELKDSVTLEGFGVYVEGGVTLRNAV